MAEQEEQGGEPQEPVLLQRLPKSPRAVPAPDNQGAGLRVWAWGEPDAPHSLGVQQNRVRNGSLEGQRRDGIWSTLRV